jgi:GntR family transcriptional regulator
VSDATAFDPAVPLQHQIYVQMRSEIEDGLWLERDDFPGERELAARFGVSVITSRAALDRLADEGWVERRRGRGTRAIHQPAASEASPGPGLNPTATRPGRVSYRYEVLEASVRIAPADACRAFGEPLGTELWQCSRLRTYRGRPHSVTHNAQRPELGARHPVGELRRRPMAELLAAQGLHPRYMRRRFHAAVAPPLVARHLDLTIVDPVLVATFTMHDAERACIEWVRIYVHPAHSAPEETMDLETRSWSTTEWL